MDCKKILLTLLIILIIVVIVWGICLLVKCVKDDYREPYLSDSEGFEIYFNADKIDERFKLKDEYELIYDKIGDN